MRTIRNTNAAMPGRHLTAQRRLLLDLIHSARGHIDAKELYRRASSQDASISLATVYRNLRLFQDLGLVDETRLGRTSHQYEPKRSAEHQHFVCTYCGRVIEFQTPLVDNVIERFQQEQGVKVTKTEFYLEGVCRQCGQRKEEG